MVSGVGTRLAEGWQSGEGKPRRQEELEHQEEN